jgi:hypothetical protein
MTKFLKMTVLLFLAACMAGQVFAGNKMNHREFLYDQWEHCSSYQNYSF